MNTFEMKSAARRSGKSSAMQQNPLRSKRSMLLMLGLCLCQPTAVMGGTMMEALIGVKFGFTVLNLFCYFVPDFKQCSTIGNDKCEDAILLQVDGDTIAGSTFAATKDIASACGEVDEPVAPGVWYKFEGTGLPVEVTTCDTQSGFDTQISVYVLDPLEEKCGPFSLLCVGGVDDGCGTNGYIRFVTEESLMYYVLVHGWLENDVGAFKIKVNPLSPPPNDECKDSKHIEVGELVSSSTDIARYDFFDSCGGASNDFSPAVWYNTIGTGKPLVAETCGFIGFDTQVAVFSGDCDDLQCIDGNDDSCGFQSSVEWDSVEGERYSIVVYGFQDAGDFELRLFAPTENDRCSNSIAIVPGQEIAGSTMEASVDDAPVCGSATAPTAGGVWYSFFDQGPGGRVVASTCSDDDNFDSQISVYTGSCGNLLCVDGNDDACSRQSSVVWDAQGGIVYYILVHGYRLDKGDFNLTLDRFEAVSNDECVNATLVSPGTPVQGSTQLATLDQDLSTCSTSFLDPFSTTTTAPGVWYKVVGTGNRMVANTCGNLTDYDTFLSVYTSPCDSLTCVAGNDDSCARSSTVTWDSDLSTEYYILVHGYSTAVGNFELEILEFQSAGNAQCEAAVELAIGDQVLGDTRAGLVATGAPECGNFTFFAAPEQGKLEENTLEKGSINVEDSLLRSTSPGLWYRLEGTGADVLITACQTQSDFDAQIKIYTGGNCESGSGSEDDVCDCSNLVCVGGNDDSCGFQPANGIETVAGQQYYILVEGFRDAAGPFVLNVEEIDLTPPENDECSDATPVFLGESVEGNTLFATNEFLGSCGGATFQTSGGVWYSVTGTGELMTASTCGFASYDTQISILTTTDTTTSCTNLQCVAGNDDGCGVFSLESFVEWQSTLGITYFIVVHGFAFGTGQFELVVN